MRLGGRPDQRMKDVRRSPPGPRSARCAWRRRAAARAVSATRASCARRRIPAAPGPAEGAAPGRRGTAGGVGGHEGERVLDAPRPPDPAMPPEPRPTAAEGCEKVPSPLYSAACPTVRSTRRSQVDNIVGEDDAPASAEVFSTDSARRAGVGGSDGVAVERCSTPVRGQLPQRNRGTSARTTAPAGLRHARRRPGPAACCSPSANCAAIPPPTVDLRHLELLLRPRAVTVLRALFYDSNIGFMKFCGRCGLIAAARPWPPMMAKRNLAGNAAAGLAQPPPVPQRSSSGFLNSSRPAFWFCSSGPPVAAGPPHRPGDRLLQLGHLRECTLIFFWAAPASPLLIALDQLKDQGLRLRRAP